MTIAAQTNRTSITGNGLTTSIPCTFPFTAQTDLVVVETIIATGAQTVKTLTTDYTVTGTVDALGQYPNGGTVVMTVAPASTVTITVYRDVPTTQSVDPVQNDKLPVDSAIEAPLDKLTMIAIRLKEQVARSLHQPDGDSANMTTLPAKTTRASRYMGFDGDGNPTMMQTPTGLVVGLAQLTESTVAGLPAAGSAGVLRKVTDNVRGVWMDTGTRWMSLVSSVDARAFNLVGDGVADDTAALQAAITAAAGQTVVIPAPSVEYKITNELTIPNNTRVLSDGWALIHQTGTNKRIFIGTNLTRVTIAGFRLRGGGTGAALADTGLIDINGGSDIRIHDNEIYDGRNGIAVYAVTNLWIERNHVYNFRKQGIIAGKSVNFHIDRNVVHTCDETGANGVYGIHATGDQAGGATQKRNSVSFNQIYDIKAWDGFMTHDVDGLLVIGNDIRDVRTGIDVGHLVAANVVKNIIIANNYIESTTTDTWSASNAVCSGIAVVGYDATHLVEGVTISGNIVKGFAAFTHATGAGGIWTAHCSHVVVIGNSVQKTHTIAAGEGTGGIFVNGTVKALSIMGNTITDAASNPSLFGVNFYTATVDQVSITGNTFRNDAAGMTTCVATKNSTAVTGMSLGPNASNLSVNSYFALGSGTSVTWNPGSVLGGSATLNFAAPGAVPGVVSLTVTVSGAVAGDKAVVTAPASYGAGFILDAFGSAVDTVTVRWAQLSGAAADPDGAGGTYSVKVMK